MNILVALDSNYVGPLTVMLHSIMCSNPSSEFSIFVAHSSLVESDFTRIRASVDPNRCTVFPVLVQDDLLSRAPTAKRISKETYYRLIAAQYLPADIDRILYLDPDIVVINELDTFYNIDFDKKFFAGASHVGAFLHHFSYKRLKMDKESPYINAGVLMMNLEELRLRQNIPYMFRFIRKNKAKLFLADQDVLNSLYFKDMIEIDPLLYNLDEKTFKNSKKFSEHKTITLDWVENNTVIVHFNGKNKPWNADYEGCLDIFYERYCDSE